MSDNMTVKPNETFGLNGTSTTSINDDLSVISALLIACVIFVLAVVGNVLVIITLVQNKHMRSVTNVFLLNLAISDLLLSVFCMPFTLIPIWIQSFIFGPFMCVSLRYAQGVSVGASVFTLVAISLERYFAICRPLHSRRWQTKSHAYKIIICCWILSAIVIIPISISTTYKESPNGVYYCREFWQEQDLERAYTVFLDVVLLLIPLCLMSGAYVKIMTTLCTGITVDDRIDCADSPNASHKGSFAKLVSLKSNNIRSFVLRNGGTAGKHINSPPSIHMRDMGDSGCSSEEVTPRKKLPQTRLIRQTNYEKSRNAKLRVVRMLFVLVVEFFVCWSPLYTFQTWQSFHAESFRENVSKGTWLYMFILSYMSSCCNPITYCFMNRRFRQSFISSLQCCGCCKPLIYLSSLGSGRTQHSSTRRMTWLDMQKAEDSEDTTAADKSRNGNVLNEP